LPETNTLAYLSDASVTKKECFMVFSPGQTTRRRFEDYSSTKKTGILSR